MRFIVLAASLCTLASAAPRRGSISNDLTDWGQAFNRWSSWFEEAAPQTLVHSLGGEENKSIYDRLRDAGEYTKLLKLIDQNRDIVKKLRDSDERITLFAPNDMAFPGHDYHLPGHGDGGGDKDRERLVREILLYHMVPKEYEYSKLGRNSTLPTELKADDGSFGGQRRRIKIERIPQLVSSRVKINNYSTISQSDIRCKNGIIQKIDRPLAPPPDIMDALYFFPQEFSIATTALLKVDLEDELEFNSNTGGNRDRKNEHHGSKMGYPATTFMAPTNEAFNKLPSDLTFFLFSPWGERALRKLMEYHVIPDYIVFTEFIKEVESKNRYNDDDDLSGDDDRDLSFECNKNFRTLVRQELPVHIKKYKTKMPGSNEYSIDFKVHGVNVETRDNPAQNGVVHVLGSVLCPRHPKSQDEGEDQQNWNEWKDWLLEWVEKN